MNNQKRAEFTLEDGTKVSIPLLPAISKGIPMARRLASIIAPAVGGTLDGIRHDDVMHGVPKTFTDMALIVCQQIDKAEINSMVFTLIEGLQINGNPVDPDEYFTANYGQLTEILEHSLRENFSSFFTGGGMKQRFQKAVGMVMAGVTNGLSSEE